MGVVINRSLGNSGRAAPGFNYYTGKMFYGTAPSGWSTYTHPLFPSVTIYAQQILSAQGALQAGIIPNTDNVAGTSTALITTKGNTGDTYQINATIPIIGGGTSVIALGLYTVGSADSTIALQGAAWAAIINANTYITGFSATFTTATITIIYPTSLGIYPNTGTPLTIVTTGAAVVAAPTFAVIAGTASTWADAYYQISEYYRENSTGNLWVGFISASSSFQELLALQLASGNQLRQCGIADTNVSRGSAANLLATVTSIQAIITLIANTAPMEIVYRPNIAAVSNLALLPNSNSLQNTNNVQVLISQDGNSQGALLFTTLGYSVSNLGAKLGTLSASRISSDDAQPISQFNVSNGIENNVPAFSNGQLLSAISVSEVAQLNSYNYVFFSTYPGIVAGTYWSSNTMFVDEASSYANMNDNRVWDAATRILQQVYTPYLNSEVQYDSSGNIDNSSIVFLQNVGVNGLTAGLITGIQPAYISGTPVVTIDPTQNLQATSNLQIKVQLTENGITRTITITNGFSN